MHVISVGQPFNAFSGDVNIDCCIMELTHDGTFMLIIYLHNMTQQEKKLLRDSTIRVRVVEEEDFLLPLIQFGSTEMIFEIDFDPFIYTDERKNLIGQSNLVNMVGVELSNRIVQTIRLMNMPKKLYSKYITAWSLMDDREGFSDRYRQWINNLHEKYSVLELWRMGVYVGKMGEK